MNQVDLINGNGQETHECENSWEIEENFLLTVQIMNYDQLRNK